MVFCFCLFSVIYDFSEIYSICIDKCADACIIKVSLLVIFIHPYPKFSVSQGLISLYYFYLHNKFVFYIIRTYIFVVLLMCPSRLKITLFFFSSLSGKFLKRHYKKNRQLFVVLLFFGFFLYHLHGDDSLKLSN